MASLVKTTMPLLFVTMGCFFLAVCNGDANIESLPPHGSPPTIAPSPYHHNPHTPAHAPMHQTPIHAPPHPTPVAPVHPPTKAPIKAPVHSPTKAPIHPPTKAPVHPVHPPTKAPVHPVHPPIKAPVHPPKKTPVHPHSKRISIGGSVYCTACTVGGYPDLSASELPGATVQLQCNSTKHPIIVKAKTNFRGYFYLHAPKTITSKNAHKCKVFLVSSTTKCNQKTNLNGGLKGVALKSEKIVIGANFSFLLVGPFAFEPKCRH